MRDCNKDRRVTLPKRVTSVTWGPPPPCKTDLKRLPAFAKWLSKLKKFPVTVILNRKRGKNVDSKRVSLHLTTTRRDIMGIHKFCRIANRSVTGTCKNCLCLTSPASSWLHISSEIGLAWCFSLKKLQQGFFSGKSSCCSFSGADICRICVELCALGLRGSHLVKMLLFLR